MDAEEKKLLGKIVEAVRNINKEASNAYFYAREIELTLRQTELAGEFDQAFQQIHSNDEIPEIASLKKAYGKSQRSLDQLARLLQRRSRRTL